MQGNPLPPEEAAKDTNDTVVGRMDPVAYGLLSTAPLATALVVRGREPAPRGEAQPGEAAAGEARGRTNGRYWLIVSREHLCAEVMDVGGKLAVFGSAEDARRFLDLGSAGAATSGVAGGGWRLRPVWAGELVSLLYAPLRGFEHVVLDPVAESGAADTGDGLLNALASVSRKEFIELLVRRAHLVCCRASTDTASAREPFDDHGGAIAQWQTSKR